MYHLDGEFVNNERYGNQFQTRSYEKVKLEGKDAVIEFYLNNKKVDSINNIDEDTIVKVKVIIIKELLVN